jgi:hypothetical protein
MLPNLLLSNVYNAAQMSALSILDRIMHDDSFFGKGCGTKAAHDSQDPFNVISVTAS